MKKQAAWLGVALLATSLFSGCSMANAVQENTKELTTYVKAVKPMVNDFDAVTNEYIAYAEQAKSTPPADSVVISTMNGYVKRLDDIKARVSLVKPTSEEARQDQENFLNSITDLKNGFLDYRDAAQLHDPSKTKTGDALLSRANSEYNDFRMSYNSIP